jgi:hypothetical protein
LAQSKHCGGKLEQVIGEEANYVKRRINKVRLGEEKD